MATRSLRWVQRPVHHLLSSNGNLIRSANTSANAAPGSTRDTVEYVRLRNLDVLLLGTAHVSAKSAEEASWAVHSFQPDSVVLELCDKRAQRMHNDENTNIEETVKSLLTSLVPGLNPRSMKERGQTQGDPVAQLLKLGTQSLYRIFRLSGLQPGGEFKAALREANAINASVVHGDRNIDETFSRLRQVLPSELPSLLSSMVLGNTPSSLSQMPPEVRNVMQAQATNLEDAIERMKDKRVVKAMTDTLRAQLPNITRVMLDERDEILANAILNQASGSRVVCVIGMAHLDGVQHRLQQHG